MATNALTIETVPLRMRSRSLWRGLLLREWWAHQQVLGLLGMLYAVSPLIFMLVGYVEYVLFQSLELSGITVPIDQTNFWPLLAWHWTYLMGVVLALVLGLALGGAETTAGLEEGSLSLPPTRAQRFWARLSFAISIILAHALLNSVALYVWDSVLMRPTIDDNLLADWAILALETPLVVLVLAWTAAVNGGPRRKPLLAVCGIGLLFLAWVLHEHISVFTTGAFGRPFQEAVEWTNWVPPVLIPWSLWMLFLAYRIYGTRDIHALQDN